MLISSESAEEVKKVVLTIGGISKNVKFVKTVGVVVWEKKQEYDSTILYDENNIDEEFSE